MNLWNRSTSTTFILIMILLLLGVVSGCGALIDAQELDVQTGPAIASDPPSERTEIILYFADWQAQHVIPERRSVVQVGGENLAEVIVRELIQGPADPYMHRALPENTKILSVEVEDGIAYVNLSGEVQAVVGSAGETMAVLSLVYSLTELPDIERVQFLIEGVRAETLSGHMFLQEPIERGPVVTHPIFLDEDRAEWLQEQADQGVDVFRRDPLEVVAFDGRMTGLTGNESLEISHLDEAAGLATVLVARDEGSLAFHLIQPERVGDDGIWMIQSISDYGIDSGRFQGQVDSNTIEVHITGVPEQVGPRVFALSQDAQESLQRLNLGEGELIRFHFTAEENQTPVIQRLERME